MHRVWAANAGLKVEGPSQARLEPKKNPDGSLDVAYFPTEPGEYAVHVLCNQDDIPKSPYMADIKPAAAGFDPSKVLTHTHTSFSTGFRHVQHVGRTGAHNKGPHGEFLYARKMGDSRVNGER